MNTPALIGPVLSDRDVELATVAQRCLMAAFDYG